ncbi:acetylcholine receptor subunit alpha-like isoform X2 [Bactrocera neohumeralis]|uniref:acetylcholine receptor subunit alpha-like isoform X2 n=1 Tax=Bactrocera neohumeralis TaxID=98809 RepID=UPI002165E541|nr:acetylcholine receptor subunit alpha-like isoform X2 [Bactrocera neohumeralis]
MRFPRKMRLRFKIFMGGNLYEIRLLNAIANSDFQLWRTSSYGSSSADGHYEITLLTKATVHSSGIVMWQPPVVYKSSCSIDVAHFPYDVQTCILKIGSWTYDGFKVDLRHMDEQQGNNIVDVGVDLSEFYMSVEWDILEVPAVR